MSSNLFLPSSRTEAFRKLSNRCPLSQDYSFISTLSFYIFPYLFSFASIRYRYGIRGIVHHGDIWVNLVRWTNQLVYTYTHTRVYMYHKLLLLYRYEISTLDVSNFFFLLRVFVVILSWSLQTSFHSPFILFLGRTGEICFFSSFFWQDYLQDRFRMEGLN